MHPLFLILILALAQTGPQVTVTTDRTSYAPGDQVTITISASGIDANQTLSLGLYIDKPDLHNLYSAELPITGGVVDLPLPEDAPEGTYTVTVMWSHEEVATNFTVVTQTQTETAVTTTATTTMSPLESQTESTPSTTTTTNATSSLASQTASASSTSTTSSASTESVSEPSNLWPAFGLVAFVTGFCVVVVVLVIAKRIKR